MRFAKRYAAGKEDTVSAAVVDRLLGGEIPPRVWREHRGMTAAEVAASVDISRGSGPSKQTLLADLAGVHSGCRGGSCRVLAARTP